MYIIFKKQKRDSLEVPFYFEKYPASDEYKSYFQTNFISTKKFILHEVNYSDDKLTIINKLVWASREAFLDYASDAFCYDTIIIPSRLHDLENNILTEITIERTS